MARRRYCALQLAGGGLQHTRLMCACSASEKLSRQISDETQARATHDEVGAATWEGWERRTPERLAPVCYSLDYVKGGLELALKLTLAPEGSARWEPKQRRDIIRDLVFEPTVCEVGGAGHAPQCRSAAAPGAAQRYTNPHLIRKESLRCVTRAYGVSGHKASQRSRVHRAGRSLSVTRL